MANNENGAETPNEVAGTQQQPVDYEKEFKALKEKYTSLNNEYIKKSDAYDKVSSENADYKRKERDKLSDEQKREQEFQDLVEGKKQIEAELKTMRLEKDLLSNGFTAEESELLIKDNFAVKTIADILKKRIEENTKSVTAGLIKKTTPSDPVGSDIDKGKEKSAFAKYQESKKKTENIVKF